ncbi:MAG: anthranilate phosphoribosyltransferase [Nitrospirae bacterium]|nr:anthranilate phosphoribosyltransferase [Nitrospirota bacterium]
MIKEAIAKLADRLNLTEAESEAVMEEIMTGQATPAQVASYLTALRMKGETVEEITGAAIVMRNKAARIRVNDPDAIDTCGTGGDRLHTFNISTTAAFIVAGAGVTVAKHGNRSVSSMCGSADVLRALGVNIDIKPEKVERCINEAGIGFLFAPLYHPAMKHAVVPRQEIGIRTMFNILGPLTNPAGAARQVVGVYSPHLTEILARVLLNIGAKHCLVVHGSDGLDEITITGETAVSEGRGGEVRTYTIRPSDFGMRAASIEDIRGGSPEENARIVLQILEGEKGPKRDVVLLNAAAGILVSGRAADFSHAIIEAEKSIVAGAALAKLESLKRMTNQG